VVKATCFHCRGTWVGSLVGEIAHAIKKKRKENTANIPKVPLILRPSACLNEKLVVRRANDTFGRENSTLKMERLG